MRTEAALSAVSSSSCSSSSCFSSSPSSFSLLSWNVLAPIYFRKGPSRSSPSEAQFPELFYKRHGQILEVLGSVDPGIICLQEHWFAQQILDLYEDKLCRQLGHAAHLLQRSDICWAGRSQDGVATFTRDRSWEVVDEHKVEFYHYGLPQDRVALVLILAERGDEKENNTESQRRLAVLCTHLTYPHSRHDMVARSKQMSACLAAIERFVPAGVPTIIVGDLNGPSTDEVARHLRHAGYRNAWEELHGRPCGVTHVDHRGNNFASDHIWIRGNIRPVEARLLPDSASDECQMVRPTVGAAAHLGPRDVASKAWGMGHCLDNWCQLSDHRPVLARFEWTA
mmetsp:Transcript_62254/g.131599  ORF Transcript_62254/g.131599 Transcript_62254/m.131599 type:complete len:339 (-) Transcript_62254:13-1029(-)